MKKQPKHKCEGERQSSWRFTSGYAKCGYNASVCYNGKWYCGIHDPLRIKAKQDVRDEMYKAKWAKSAEARRRRQAEYQYCQKLDTEYLETHVGKEQVNMSSWGKVEKC